MRIPLLLSLFLTIPLCAQTNLIVKSASSKQVSIAWTGSASNYNVQRALLGGSFATIATATTTSYTDSTVDAYTSYQYRIAAASGSATSNAVTVGPPPSGFSNAAPAPVLGGSQVTSYGSDLSMTLDGNGDPAFAFIFEDPNQDGDASDTEVLFRSWNRAQYQWNGVVKVAAPGDISATTRNSVSLAYDAGTGTFGIACEDILGNNYAIDLYTSTDGVAWTKKTALVSPNGNAVGGPSLALANGNVYLAYNEDDAGTSFYTGKLSAASSTWQHKQPALPSGMTAPDSAYNPSVALDSSGNPAVAVWVGDATQEYNAILLFWRPLTGVLTKVSDTENNQSDLSVKLVFFGSAPRILFYGLRDDAVDDIGDYFVLSNDGGSTWQQPVVIPPDGHSSTDYPFDLALDSKGDVAVAFGQNAGTGDAVCGNPKLSLSSDNVHFSTCAVADVSITGSYNPYPEAIQAAYGGNDRLYLFWWDTSSPTSTGIMMYRQPPAGASTAPSILSDGTGVLNGATNQPGGTVAGSWVAIKGANFSDVTTDWSNADFSNGLPTTLNGVQVMMNGSPAAIYYLSSGQINVQAPAAASGSTTVQVVRNGVPSNTVTVNSSTAAPGLFAYSLDLKTYYPAAVFLDGVILGDPATVGGTRAAHAGDRILLFATGLGTSPAGVLINAPVAFGNAVQVMIGSAPATVEFTGLVAPGEFQINIVVPAGLSPGNHPITLQTGGLSSQTGVVIPIGQ